MDENIILDDINDLIKNHIDLWREFNRKRIFITGATGFIGSFLVKLFMKLSGQGINVKLVLLVFSRHEAEQKLGKYFDESRIKLIEQDITSPLEIDSDVDFVIHTASKANPTAYITDPVGTITTNVVGTNNVFKALLGKHVKKVLYLSSMEVYGKHGENGTISEDVIGVIDSKKIRSCYPLSKSCTENLCFSYSEQYGIPSTVVRLAYIYGAGDNINDPKVVTAFMNDILNGRNIILKSDGVQERTYCYIKDAVFGILVALLKGENKQVYNISSMSNTITIRGIAEIILKLFGNNEQKLEQVIPSEFDTKQFSLVQNNILDNNKIKALGYVESIDIMEGLMKTGLYFGLLVRGDR